MEEMQNKAVVFFVFYLWSTVEIFRWVEMLGWCLYASALDQLSSRVSFGLGLRFHLWRVVAASTGSTKARQSFLKLSLDPT